MSDTVIRVENLGKKYIIGHQQQERYTALRDVIANKVKSLDGLINPKAKVENPAFEEFWALKDVSFEIKQGDRVGIIGRNGAGKSTLLKILSRITEPTQGNIKIKGRVASLLEVGTGFHPELTGRENIFLNGAILGMGKVEIKRKFDEIVAFAEVEKFLDTPVKRYSSGMYVRLAFAVAAHLEPEILIVDEVLAVGDTQFQKKCLGKMEDVGKEGRTVLFVSHQMAAIENLCSRSILLKSGEISFDGATKTTINYYLQDLDNSTKNTNISTLRRSGSGSIVLTKFSLEDLNGNSLIAICSGDDVIFVFDYEIPTDKLPKNVSLGFSLHDMSGQTLSILYSDYSGTTFSPQSAKGQIKCMIPNFPYAPGRYYIGIRILENGIEADWPKGFVGSIDVESGDFYGTGIIAHSGIGSVLIKGNWHLLECESVNI
ncbi:ABC transporter ATP-binding protein [Nodularia sp. UHCC 0506]|uniref:ABC transporter ATP-binding protein n=1 Tax=Nodularia sp. UHCC 0506 TaxID=3110243 RepID=UPI002B1EFE92|nr:ABC transporter ATP-binding protein [Nodularia sp. UHCC 0506]MEA5516178.1 ABC transporter ATP-binding protein [Nodularia sp. UHCC 0506]